MILFSLWVQVKIDVKINEWFGKFYDMIQKALGSPNSITIEEYWDSLFSFISLAGMYVGLYVIISYFTVTKITKVYKLVIHIAYFLNVSEFC